MGIIFGSSSALMTILVVIASFDVDLDVMTIYFSSVGNLESLVMLSFHLFLKFRPREQQRLSLDPAQNRRTPIEWTTTWPIILMIIQCVSAITVLVLALCHLIEYKFGIWVSVLPTICNKTDIFQDIYFDANTAFFCHYLTRDMEDGITGSQLGILNNEAGASELRHHLRFEYQICTSPIFELGDHVTNPVIRKNSFR